MLSLTVNKTAFDFHKKTIKCWLLKKIKGNRSLRNTAGHKCDDEKCSICKKSLHRFDLPVAFIHFLNENRLDLLISGNSNQLYVLNQEFKDLNLSEDDTLKIVQLFVETGYKNWFQPEYGNKFLNKINQDTCTYCNRNYTLQIIPERSRAELDHWFPKETYPLLALSFYNLIPSCHSCNHMKLNNTIDDSYAHPYMLKEDNHVFKFRYKYSKEINDFEIIFDVESTKMQNSLRDFKIKEIYDIHSKRELKDLLNLRYKYSDNYIDILINKTFKDLNMSEEEIYRMIFGIETKEEDYHKRPFSKFKHDIIEELKNIK